MGNAQTKAKLVKVAGPALTSTGLTKLEQDDCEEIFCVFESEDGECSEVKWSEV